jgi:FKBP-type peptidyl-prolyl cis-trans isomerase
MKKYIWLSVLCVFLTMGCSPTRTRSGATIDADYTTTASGLKYRIAEQGSGELAVVGKEVLIRETTSYRDGTVLYSNEHSGSPVKVLIGGNQATTAVDEGLRGMKVGEVRYLIAPPHLVKRISYPDNVSPDSTLLIKIILLDIVK